jgi:ABC-type uncharacterized transport system permease subunit
MFISLGYLIAALARTVESANGISGHQLPHDVLVGNLLPLAFLPVPGSVVKALPLTPSRRCLPAGSGGKCAAVPLMVDVLVLAGWTVVCPILAALASRE